MDAKATHICLTCSDPQEHGGYDGDRYRTFPAYFRKLYSERPADILVLNKHVDAGHDVRKLAE